MVDMSADVPPRVMDLLKIFLTASTRGEQAVLILESRNGTLSTKFRSLEDIVAGPPAPTAKLSVKRRKNPARARRSQLRLEEFIRKKLEEKEKAAMKPQTEKDIERQAVGDTSCKSNKLVLELPSVKDKSVVTSLPSPILQVDGEQMEEGKMKYQFISNYVLDEILPAESFKLECLHQCPPRSADCIYSVVVYFIIGSSRLNIEKQAKFIFNLQVCYKDLDTTE